DEKGARFGPMHERDLEHADVVGAYLRRKLGQKNGHRARIGIDGWVTGKEELRFRSFGEKSRRDREAEDWRGERGALEPAFEDAVDFVFVGERRGQLDAKKDAGRTVFAERSDVAKLRDRAIVRSEELEHAGRFAAPFEPGRKTRGEARK